MSEVLAVLWPHSLTQQNDFKPPGFASTLLFLTSVCAPGNAVTFGRGLQSLQTMYWIWGKPLFPTRYSYICPSHYPLTKGSKSQTCYDQVSSLFTALSILSDHLCRQEGQEMGSALGLSRLKLMQGVSVMLSGVAPKDPEIRVTQRETESFLTGQEENENITKLRDTLVQFLGGQA